MFAHSKLGDQSVVRIPSTRSSFRFQKYVFQLMVKRSPPTLTLSSLTHDLKTPVSGLGTQNGPGERRVALEHTSHSRLR